MRMPLPGLFVLFSCLAGDSIAWADGPEKPRLLVLVVFDQLRGDYLERWQPLFGEGGFARLQKEGAYFKNCQYPYANTQTGPGHASMLTGCCPDQHGIVMNQWYDRKSASVVNCSQSARYQRVPALPARLAPEEFKEEPKKIEMKLGPDDLRDLPKGKQAGSPDFILAPTVADVLKDASAAKAKVVGLSFKDRSALLPAGPRADAVYWLDSADGLIVTSTFYRDSVHPWVAEFNASRFADQWFGKDWVRLRSDLNYDKLAGPDEVAGEGKGVKQGVVFPHPIDGGLKQPGKSYYEALFLSPFGNDLLLELTKRAITAEKLGQDDVTDLLVVSFSSNDAIGHTWGPDSHEVLDVTLRSDRVMADLLNFLDKQVGAGKYLIALTADHGICPLPEVSAAKGLFAKRLPAKKYIAALEQHLRATFDQEIGGAASTSRWIENFQPPWIYLNENLIDAKGLKIAAVAREGASFLAKQEGIYRTFTRPDLALEFPLNDPIGQRVKRSFHADRCGDICYVVSPYCLMSGFLTGTDHGSPHVYDTHVPLIFFGTGIKPGMHQERVTPQTIAAVFADAAHVSPPKFAVYPTPNGVFLGK